MGPTQTQTGPNNRIKGHVFHVFSKVHSVVTVTTRKKHGKMAVDGYKSSDEDFYMNFLPISYSFIYKHLVSGSPDLSKLGFIFEIFTWRSSWNICCIAGNQRVDWMLGACACSYYAVPVWVVREEVGWGRWTLRCTLWVFSAALWPPGSPPPDLPSSCLLAASWSGHP